MPDVVTALEAKQAELMAQDDPDLDELEALPPCDTLHAEVLEQQKRWAEAIEWARAELQVSLSMADRCRH